MATLLQSGGALTVGRKSYFNGNGHIVALPEAPVSIGSYCAIGRNFMVMPVNHDTRFAAVQGTLYREVFGQPHPGETGDPSRRRSKGGVSVGNDVWIADNVTLLSGVSVGDGACIGAGSVVTRSIKAFAVAAGVPCREIGSRFSEPMVALLAEVRWWDWPEDRILRNRSFFLLDLTATSADRARSTIVP